MPNSSNLPYIPTGFEPLQEGIARKRKIADALLARGLEGPGPNAQSWAQLLGSLAQAWAGKSIQKDADKSQAEVNQQIQQASSQAQSEFAQAMQSGVPQDKLYEMAQKSPFLAKQAELLGNVLEDKYKAGNTYDKGPVKGIDASGNPVTQVFNKLGESKAIEGFALPPDIKEINGQFVNLDQVKGGDIAPQNLNDLVIRGPDGQAITNDKALQAKTQVALAGSPKTETKITIDNAKEFIGPAIERLSGMADGAKGAVQRLNQIDIINENLKDAFVGPFSGAGSYLKRVAGLDDKGLASRQRVERALNQLVLAARSKLKGQGQISDFESKLLVKADSGEIDKLSAAEIKALVDEAETESYNDISQYETTYERASRLKGADNGIELFRIDIPTRYRKNLPKKEAPTTSRAKPLPPSATPVKSKVDSDELLRRMGIL